MRTLYDPLLLAGLPAHGERLGVSSTPSRSSTHHPAAPTTRCAAFGPEPGDRGVSSSARRDRHGQWRACQLGVIRRALEHK